LHASKINTGQAAKGKKPPRNRWPEGKKKGTEVGKLLKVEIHLPRHTPKIFIHKGQTYKISFMPAHTYMPSLFLSFGLFFFVAQLEN